MFPSRVNIALAPERSHGLKPVEVFNQRWVLAKKKHGASLGDLISTSECM